ncbi:MAG: proline dehydrogenase family protein [Thaumarchaeota archaeon]|nr:proline dehydrogenase family protein [Nitrososphaerota archaeon]MDE1866701.1 proline dehydrogenase family protein [Nitrososphaerota archaeon]
MEKFLFRIAKQWIAGDTMNEALQSAKTANKNGMSAIINRLGEHMVSKEQICNVVSEYLTLVSNLRKFKVDGGISVKPTQVGMTRNVEECTANLEKIIEKASISQSFVWIDMESSEYTDDTLRIYLKLFEKYERFGIAIQANLKRTEQDLKRLLEHGAKIRLVKGAYRENGRVAYKTRHEVDENYKRLTRMLFLDGNEFAIATHDSKMIEIAIDLSKKHERKFEFQMLKGIRDELKPILIKNGFSISEYIPYGTNWLPYSIRRLKERKCNILLLGSSFLHSHRV